MCDKILLVFEGVRIFFYSICNFLAKIVFRESVSVNEQTIL